MADDDFWLSELVGPLKAQSPLIEHAHALAALAALRQELGIPDQAELAMIVVKPEPGRERWAVYSTTTRAPRLLRLGVGQRCPPIQVNLFGTFEGSAPAETVRPWVGLEDGHSLRVWAGSAILADGHGVVDVTWGLVYPKTRMMLQYAKWLDADAETLGQAARWLETIPRTPGPPSGTGAR